VSAARAARLLLCVALLASGCATVPQNRRARLADPIMQFQTDTLEAHRKAKFYSTREAAAGGDGVPAGGGCGCQ
jgi:starvation-inducible outer membrane lipoprotein